MFTSFNEIIRRAVRPNGLEPFASPAHTRRLPIPALTAASVTSAYWPIPRQSVHVVVVTALIGYVALAMAGRGADARKRTACAFTGFALATFMYPNFAQVFDVQWYVTSDFVLGMLWLSSSLALSVRVARLPQRLLAVWSLTLTVVTTVLAMALAAGAWRQLAFVAHWSGRAPAPLPTRSPTETMALACISTCLGSNKATSRSE